MMNPEIKKQWIETLRSGKYKQGDNKLEDKYSGSLCCLGVLCKIVGEPTFTIHNIELGIPGGSDAQEFQGLSLEKMQFLATNNDIGKSFIEIAEIIEKDKEI